MNLVLETTGLERNFSSESSLFISKLRERERERERKHIFGYLLRTIRDNHNCGRRESQDEHRPLRYCSPDNSHLNVSVPFIHVPIRQSPASIPRKNNREIRILQSTNHKSALLIPCLILKMWSSYGLT
ncbi:uncharacterized protein LOC112692665 [Sipha flava]|uniref:Uncharacterized protein LOC112692665 n=1 Tax=Sipha flava TaxID=143950 RepID=A0A8B8GJI1_9HEMI|nr:uncharacterized protein LOC112692665 [Sipha flava]